MNKAFTKILNKRIYNYLTENNFWAPNQNGFMKGKRTEDNIFIIHTIFQKYVKLGKGKIYTTFVDFRKYFDCINRNCLMYKLIKCGITGKMYKVIKASYNNPQFCIKTLEGLSCYFSSTTGVKQGCILSPLLSNIFQNDLHEIFDASCDPVSLNNITLNSLSWADDLVIMSMSKQGLQNSINKLYNYCNKWGLSVNTDKTKCMLLSLGNAKMPSFTLGDKILTNVQTYKYLGIVLHKNGKFSHAIKDRISKTNRAIHVIKQVLGYSSNVSVKLALSLFDKLIAPILLYGSSIWSIPDCNRHILIEVDKIDNKVKTQVHNIIHARLNRNVTIDETRAYRDKNKILVKLHNIADKLDLLHSNNTMNGVSISDHTTHKVTDYELPHSAFCKYTLGASKFSSVTGVLSELGRYPIAIKAWVQSISYWHRLETGETGELIKNSYIECRENNHPFYQNVQYLLNKNGLGNITTSPQIYNTKQVVSLAKQSMTDQHKQNIHNYIQTNDKFLTIRQCTQNEDEQIDKYLYYNKIRSPVVRKCFVRLRLDNAYKYNSRDNDNICDQCNVNIDSKHLLTNCLKTNAERTIFINKITPFIPNIINMNSVDQMKFILNLKHNNENVINYICTFVKNICINNKMI